MTAQAVRERVGGAWVERSDGWWCSVRSGEILAIARAVRVDGVRFAALTLFPEGDRMRFAWHWDCEGVLLTAEALADPGQAVHSIAGTWPGADWAEREARDYYAVSFEGRDSTPPLMLREEETPGVLLRPGGKEQA